MIDLYIPNRTHENIGLLIEEYKTIYELPESQRDQKFRIMQNLLVEKFSVPRSEARGLDLVPAQKRIWLELRRLAAYRLGLTKKARIMVGSRGPYILLDIDENARLVVGNPKSGKELKAHLDIFRFPAEGPNPVRVSVLSR